METATSASNIPLRDGPGVKTDEGKAKVRHNAFKHGMTASTLLSSLAGLNESQADYLQLVAGLSSSYKPQNYAEECLIEQMAKALFKLRRFDLLEAKVLVEDDYILSWPTSTSLENLGLALKYKQSLEAQFYRALEFLIRTRTAATQLDLFLPEPEGK